MKKLLIIALAVFATTAFAVNPGVKKDKKKKKDNNNACPPPCSCAEVEKKARASNADFMSIDKPENYMSIK